MRLARKVKDITTYIEDVQVVEGFNKDTITVEHRSNNPKRDFLFVNKLQCKHIPCSPKDMQNMCKLLAEQVNTSLRGNERVLVIGFAETATAIGTMVYNELEFEKYLLHTTREEVANAKQLVTFEEEHSHATTQLLLTYTETGCDYTLNLDEYSYILFVEDEISTGKTILNFIDAFEKENQRAGRVGFRYGVASICNWQNDEDANKFLERGIDRFCLISGKLKDASAKMEGFELAEDKDFDETHVQYDLRETFKKINYSEICLNNFPSLFRQHRLGTKDITKAAEATFKSIMARLSCRKNVQSIRIVGTEEFMDLPIMVGAMLEDAGYDVICHATTRSKIDIMKDDSCGTASGIKCRDMMPSAYEDGRATYIYNADYDNGSDETDITILLSDTENVKQFERLARVLHFTNVRNENELLAFRLV